MSVPEIDQTFTSLINMSAELLSIARPRTPFDSLKPVVVTPRIELDFSLISTFESSKRAYHEKEYNALFTELKRFEPKALTFSSLEPGQGVTFTASNIARLWAKESEKKVLLLEFYNGFSGSEYENIKDEEAESANDPQLLENFISYAVEENLYTLSLRSASVNADITEFWTRLSSSFDLIIIDAAPMGFNIMTDYAISQSTGVILISAKKPDPTSVKVFEKETRELGGRFLGVILNAMD